MTNMVLDSYTFESNPSRISPLIRKKKTVSYVETLEDVGFFDWGYTYKGLKLDLEWDFMTTTMFDALEIKHMKVGPLVFDPQDGESKTFSVNTLSLEGTYYMTTEDYMEDSDIAVRKDVKMSILIMSEV
jgi:hypothetical protein